MEGYLVISSKKVSLCDIEYQQQQNGETSSQPEVEEIPSSPSPFDVVDVACSPDPFEVIEIPCSPVPDEVVELLSDDDNGNEEISCEDTNSPEEVLGFLTNNDSNAPKEPKQTSCQDINSSEGLVYLPDNDINAPNEPEVIVTYDNNVHLSYDNNESNGVQQNSTDINFFGSSTAPLEQDNSMQLGTFNTSNEIYIDQNGQIQNEAVENCSEYFTIDFIASPNESNSAIDLSDADDGADMPMCSETDDATEIGEGALEEGDPRIIGRRCSRVPSKTSIDQYISYICPQCGIDCGPVDKWRLHTETEHDFGLLETANMQSIVNKQGNLCHKCRDCPRMYALKTGFSALILHRISHLPFKYYLSCLICQVRYRTKASLKRHLQREHKDLKVCTNPRFHDSALEHIRFFCPVCKEEQINDLDWRAHMKEQHDYYNQARSKFEHVGNNLYNCNICLMKVRVSTLVEHCQTHEDFKPFVCTFCNQPVSQLKAALSHVRFKHLRTPKELLSKCSLCQASFKSLRKRRKHYITKHKVAFQTCKICKKEFESSSSLLSHMNFANHHTLKSRT